MARRWHTPTRMDPSRFAFLVLPNYSLIAVSNALEVLRMANRVAGRDIYEWSIASLDGRPVPASSGLELAPTIALDKIGKVEILFVCGGIDVPNGENPPDAASLAKFGSRPLSINDLVRS